MWDKGWLHLLLSLSLFFFFFNLLNGHIFCNFNTTDYFCSSVIHLIRRYYIHISWKGGGRGWRFLVMALPIAASPLLIFILQRGRGKESNSSATSSQYFTLPQKSQRGGKWELCVCFQRVSSESREGRKRPNRERSCSVLDPAAWGPSVEGDELCLCAARHGLRCLLLRLLRLLLLLRGATRGSNLAAWMHK